MAKQPPAAENNPSNEARYGAADAVSRPLLSVVIPVYNATPYLPQLIDSLLAQVLVPDEVIFVDDGSTDGSTEMIARLGAGLTGLRVIGRNNEGASVARNVGMREATGRYLAFLDADDMLDPAMYSTLVDLAEREQLDIAMGNTRNFYEGRKPDTLMFRGVADSGVITGETWFQQRWLAESLPHYCWIHVYRRSFIDRHGFVFPPADPHEDVIWTTETLLAAQRFHFVPAPLHWYRKKNIFSVPPPALAPDGTFRRHRVVESSIYNTFALSEIAARKTLQPLTRKLLRKEFVNDGCQIVKQIRGLSDAAQRIHYLGRIRQESLFPLLWQNAAGLTQRWRVLRYHLLGYVLALAAQPDVLRRHPRQV